MLQISRTSRAARRQGMGFRRATHTVIVGALAGALCFAGSPTAASAASAATVSPASLRTPTATPAPVPDAPVPATATATELTREVTYNGKTITIRLHPITIRDQTFQVLVQQADGTLVPAANLPAERGWLGAVDGDSSAVASGIVQSNGLFEGEVVFDRGGTWWFADKDATGATTVTGTRGLTPPASYTWPSSTNTALNVSPMPGQAGAITYKDVLGFDLANNWFRDPATINGDVNKALDAVEYEVSSFMGVYETDLKLRPALGRVIIRADAAKDPYAAGNIGLSVIQNEWSKNQAGCGADDVILLTDPAGGGGLAYVATAGSANGVARVSGRGATTVAARHELAHNWGVRDNNTDGPEGPAIESGNAYDRFDGTEVSAIFRYRDSIASRLTAVPAIAEPLPPYAALDLYDKQLSGIEFSFDPVANDHDANGDPLLLAAIPATTKLGGTIEVTAGGVRYTPPAVSTAGPPDWVTYVVRDSVTGKTATGVAEFRVDPAPAPSSPSSWPAAQVPTGTPVEIASRGSGLDLTTGTTQLVQHSFTGPSDWWTLTESGAGYQIKNAASGLCADMADTANGAVIKAVACTGEATQQFTVLANPVGGDSIVSAVSGWCITVGDGSLAQGAAVTQDDCGLQLTRIWNIATPPVTEWPAAAVNTAKPELLTNTASGLQAAFPAANSPATMAAGGYTELVPPAPWVT